MINWLDQNNLKHARAGRQLNNYSLTEQSTIARSYRNLVQQPDYLEQIPDDFLPKSRRKIKRVNEEDNANPPLENFAEDLPQMYFALRAEQNVSLRAQLSLWVKSYTSRPRVILAVDEVLVCAAQGAHSFVLQNPCAPEYSGAATTPSRKAIITTYVYDERNRFVQSQRIPIVFKSTPD